MSISISISISNNNGRNDSFPRGWLPQREMAQVACNSCPSQSAIIAKLVQLAL